MAAVLAARGSRNRSTRRDRRGSGDRSGRRDRPGLRRLGRGRCHGRAGRLGGLRLAPRRLAGLDAVRLRRGQRERRPPRGLGGALLARGERPARTAPGRRGSRALRRYRRWPLLRYGSGRERRYGTLLHGAATRTAPGTRHGVADRDALRRHGVAEARGAGLRGRLGGLH
ncbi:hypothetical protein AB0N23_36695, partial [Streptomyces sp. NPDC052644]